MDSRPADAGPAWARRFFAVTPFVDDLARDRQWYRDVFGMPIVDESPDSCTFRFPGNVFINLNTSEAGAALLEPAAVGGPGTPARMSPVQGARSRPIRYEAFRLTSA